MTERRIKITPTLSKQVGWELGVPEYPTLEEVAEASDFQILFWFRHLPRAETPEQFAVIYELCEIFGMHDDAFRSGMGQESKREEPKLAPYPTQEE